MSTYREPRHIAVLHALNDFLNEPGNDSVLQLTLTRNEKGEILLTTFPSLGEASSMPLEGEPPQGDKEVGETLRLIGERIVREADGRRAA